MYKYEGIGSIYWHQNSKFMLSLQEVFTNGAHEDSGVSAALKEAYYRLYNGFGFRKTPKEWGAFPLEPYSHTPYEMPAQQPGMTGQVKEDILTRMAELGIVVKGGILSFDTALLRKSEFMTNPGSFRYIDINGKFCELSLPADSLAFTVCQVPVIYRLGDENALTIRGVNSNVTQKGLSLTKEQSGTLFNREGVISNIEVSVIL
jgi:hypothetical protein